MKHRFAVLVILIVALSSLVGGFVGGSAAAGPVPQTSQNEFLSSFAEALDVIQRNYVDRISADQLVYGAIKGMLRSLDPHSSFFDPKEFARLREEQHSRYSGVGIVVLPLSGESGRVVIVEPPAIGSPAKRRGLRAGDVITHIEGKAIDDLTFEEVVNHRLRGPRGTWVNITVERPGIRNPLQFKVERDEIPIVTVPYAFEVIPGMGYIKIDRFAESTADELKRKLESLGATQLSGLILDLRNNPGGLLNQAIEVADLFLPRGKIVVSTKGRMRGSDRSYRAPSGEKRRCPLVVLINKQSASAAEVVAGALQDHDRALIVGDTSFGKGLVQSIYTLGNYAGMALTTARYYTPSGRLIQRDYSGTSTEYYFLGSGMLSTGGPREIRHTDSGRKVLGGGGITPDIEEPAREPNRVEALLSAKRAFFEYARRLTSGQVPVASDFKLPLKNEEVSVLSTQVPEPIPNLEITRAILEDFKEYLRGRSIDFKESDIQENIDFIKRGIKQEVYTSFFGRQEGFKIAIQADRQIKKALEVLPEAKWLMTTGHMSPNARNQGVK